MLANEATQAFGLCWHLGSGLLLDAESRATELLPAFRLLCATRAPIVRPCCLASKRHERPRILNRSDAKVREFESFHDGVARGLHVVHRSGQDGAATRCWRCNTFRTRLLPKKPTKLEARASQMRLMAGKATLAGGKMVGARYHAKAMQLDRSAKTVIRVHEALLDRPQLWHRVIAPNISLDCKLAASAVLHFQALPRQCPG